MKVEESRFRIGRAGQEMCEVFGQERCGAQSLLALWVGVRGGQRIVGWPPDVSTAVAEALALAAILAIVALLAASARRAAGE